MNKENELCWDLDVYDGFESYTAAEGAYTIEPSIKLLEHVVLYISEDVSDVGFLQEIDCKSTAVAKRTAQKHWNKLLKRTKI